jgi:copper chaperone CopZ
MTLDKILVLLGGAAAIVWVNWYFFFARRAAAAASSSPSGTQEMLITVAGGYTPDLVRVTAGRPVRLVFDRRETNPCSEEIVIPDFGIRRFLPPARRPRWNSLRTARACTISPAGWGCCTEGDRRMSSTVTLPVSGMTCAACQARIQRALEKAPGVEEAAVNLLLNSATVRFDPAVTSPDQLVGAVRETGYGADLPPDAPDPAAEELVRDAHAGAEFRALRLKAGVSLALGLIAMVLSMPVMAAGAASGIPTPPIPCSRSPPAGSIRRFGASCPGSIGSRPGPLPSCCSA